MAKKAKAARKGKGRGKKQVTEADIPGRVLSGSIVPKAYKAAMAEHKDTNGSRLSLTLKDATTKIVDNRAVLDVDALWAIAKKNGIDHKPYVDLNNGQKRMNVGNKLRGLVRDGETVDIGGTKLSGPAAIKSKTAGQAEAE